MMKIIAISALLLLVASPANAVIKLYGITYNDSGLPIEQATKVQERIAAPEKIAEVAPAPEVAAKVEPEIKMADATTVTQPYNHDFLTENNRKWAAEIQRYNMKKAAGAAKVHQ